MSLMRLIRAIGKNISTFIVALIPVFKSCPPCPICMPKYAALFAIFGLKLADYSVYLIPVMILSMLWTLFSIYQNIKVYYLHLGHFLGSFICCCCLLIFKFIFVNVFATYISMCCLFCMLLYHYYCLNHVKSCCNKSTSCSD